MKDLGSNLAVVASLIPQLASGNGTTTATNGVDLVGFESAMLVLSAGTQGDTLAANLKYTVKIQDSTDNTTFVDVGQAGITGATLVGGVWLTLDAAGKVSQSYKAGYIGGKRYVRASIVRTGNHANGTPISVECVKGSPHHAPVQG